MKSRSLPFILLGIVLLTLSLCSRKQKDPVLFQFGSDRVYVSDFYKYNSEFYFNNYPNEEKLKVVNRYFVKELMLYDALKKDYASQQDIVAKINEQSKNALIRVFLDRSIRDTIITEDMMMQTYNNSEDIFKATHPFEEEKKQIIDKLINLNRGRLQQAYYKFIEDTKFNFDVVLQAPAIQSLAQQFAEERDGFQPDSTQNKTTPLDILKRVGGDEVLVTYKLGKIKTSDLLAELETYPDRVPPNLDQMEMVSSILDAIVFQNILLNLAHKMKIERDPDYLLDMDEFRKETILTAYINTEIDAKIKPTDGDMLAFYEHNKDSLYLTTAKAEVQEIYLKDRELAEKILRRALQGENFGKLADQHTTRFTEKAKKGYLGFITTKQYGGIGRVAPNLAPNTVYGELIPSGKGFSIIKVFNVQPSVPKSYDQVESRVRTDCYNEIKKSLRMELLQSLKQKYNAKIFLENVGVTVAER